MKGFEIRRNEDGTIDEVVAHSDDGTLYFHIEQMSKGGWALGLRSVDPEGEYHQFNIYRKKKAVVLSSYDDSPPDSEIRREIIALEPQEE